VGQGGDLSLEEELEEGERHQREILESILVGLSAAREQLEDCLQFLRSFGLRSDVTYVFEVLDTLVPVASSCPNGRVYFSRGLLESLTHDEVLFFAPTRLLTRSCGTMRRGCVGWGFAVAAAASGHGAAAHGAGDFAGRAPPGRV